MFLKKISIAKFKTFQNFNLQEEFSPNINVIIGKIGNGKSNLLSAISYVLSDIYSHIKEDNKKKLFNKEFREIVESGQYDINNENTKNENHKFSINLLFDNKNKTLNIDKDEVNVFRSYSILKNVDETLINSKQVSRSELFRVFSNYMLDNNFYIVQQGKIDKIISSSKEELMEICCEVFGIKELENCIENWNNEINDIKSLIVKLDSNLNHTNDMTINLEKQCYLLNEFREEEKLKNAYEFIIYSEKKRQEEFKFNKFIEEKKEYQKNYNSSLINYNKITETFNLYSQRKLRLEKRLNTLEENIKKCDDEIYNILKAKQDKEINTKAKNFYEGHQSDNLNLSFINVQNNSKNSNDVKINTYEQLNFYKIKLENELKELNLEKQKLNNCLEETNSIINNIKMQIESFNNNNSLIKFQKVIFNECLQQKYIDEKRIVIATKIEEINKDIEKIQYNNININNETNNINNSIKECKTSMVNLINYNNNYSSSSSSYNSEIELLNNSRIKLANDLKIVNQELNTNLISIDFLKGIELEEKSNFMYYDNYITARNIIDANIEGVYGYLMQFIDLESINNKYFTAIELSAKQKLFSIIVDNKQTALNVINYNNTNFNGHIIHIYSIEDFMLLNNNKEVFRDNNVISLVDIINIKDVNKTLQRDDITCNIENNVKLLDNNIISHIINKILSKYVIVSSFELGIEYAKSKKLNCITSNNDIIESGAIIIKSFCTNRKSCIDMYLKSNNYYLKKKHILNGIEILNENKIKINEEDKNIVNRLQEIYIIKQKESNEIIENKKKIVLLKKEIENYEEIYSNNLAILLTNNKFLDNNKSKLEFLNYVISNINITLKVKNFTDFIKQYNIDNNDNNLKDIDKNKIIRLEEEKLSLDNKIYDIEKEIYNIQNKKIDKINNDLNELVNKMNMLKCDNNINIDNIFNTLDNNITTDNQVKNTLFNSNVKKGKNKKNKESIINNNIVNEDNNSHLISKNIINNRKVLLVNINTLEALNQDLDQFESNKNSYVLEKVKCSNMLEEITNKLSNLKINELDFIKSDLSKKETILKLANKKIKDSQLMIENINNIFNNNLYNIESNNNESYNTINSVIKKELNQAKVIAQKNYDVNSNEYSSMLLKPFYKKLNELNDKLKKYNSVDRLANERLNQFKDKNNQFKKYIKDLKTKVEIFNSFISVVKDIKENKFTELFINLKKNFNNFFKKLVPNGECYLELIDILDDKSNSLKSKKKGIELKVNFDISNQEENQSQIDSTNLITNNSNYSNKHGKLFNLKELSGGQKSITALSLIFALALQSNPPFIILDEVEAALDSNAKYNLSNLIKEVSSKGCQFFINSSKQETVNIADKIFLMSYSSIGSILQEIDKNAANEFLENNKF